MKIYRLGSDTNFEKWRDWHVVTVAKVDNSALGIYAWGLYRVDVETFRKFSDDVNATYTAKSLYPKAPVSSVPMRYFCIEREAYFKQYIEDFRRHIREIMEINRTQIHARKIVFDFHMSIEPVPECYLAAAEEAMKELLADDEVDEVALIK